MKDEAWYGASVSTVGIVLVASGGVLLLLMLYQFVGPFRFLESVATLPVRETVLWLPADASPQQPATARRIAGWRRVLPGAGRIRRGPGFPLPPSRFVLAVPDARRLAGAEIGGLLDFTRRGGGVVVSGSLGVRDATDGWRGYEGMVRVLGVTEVVPLAAELTAALRAGGRGPLAAALTPDKRVSLLPEEGLPSVPVSGAELVWNGAEPEPRPFRGASRRLELGRGRLVWVAAGPEVGVEASLPDLDRVLQAAVAWAAREPVVALLPPPGEGEARLEAWRRLDAMLDTRAERVGAERLLVSVTHRGSHPVEEVALEIYVGSPVGPATVKATVLGQELPELRRWPGDERVELRLPGLDPGSHAWNVEWSGAPTPEETT